MAYEVLEYRWITRTSPLSGKTRKAMIGARVTEWLAFDRGELVQKALPGLSPQEREFVLTGITAQEWDEAFKEDE